MGWTRLGSSMKKYVDESELMPEQTSSNYVSEDDLVPESSTQTQVIQPDQDNYAIKALKSIPFGGTGSLMDFASKSAEMDSSPQAIRSLIQGTGYNYGATNPEKIPSFQELALNRFSPKTDNVLTNYIGGTIPSAIGLSADIATDPKNALAALFGMGFMRTGTGAMLGNELRKPINFRDLITGGRGRLQKTAPTAAQYPTAAQASVLKDDYSSQANEMNRRAALVKGSKNIEINRLNEDAQNSIYPLKDKISKAQSEKNALALKQQEIALQISENRRLHANEAKDVAYRGASGRQEAVEADFAQKLQDYRTALDNTKGVGLPKEDLLGILNRVIEEKGIRAKQILDTPERNILNLSDNLLKNKLGTDGTEIIQLDGNSLPADQVKTFKNIVRSQISGRKDLEASFYKHFGDTLENGGMGEISQANKGYSSAYDNAYGAKAINKSNLSQVAMGKISESHAQMADLLSSEAPYGTDFVRQAQNVFKKYSDSQKALAESLGKVVSEKQLKEQFIAEIGKQIKDGKIKLNQAKLDTGKTFGDIESGFRGEARDIKSKSDFISTMRNRGKLYDENNLQPNKPNSFTKKLFKRVGSIATGTSIAFTLNELRKALTGSR